MIQLEYKPTPKSRTWRKGMIMNPEGRANMESTAKALVKQEGWHAWRIVSV